MKTTLLFLSVFLSANLFGQNVYIPDANFKAYLVGDSEINTNGDTEIQVSEANVFTGTIDCDNEGVLDLTGIEAFTALVGLDCGNNQLTSLDVSQNTSLTVLKCGYNQLTSLDLSNNTSLFLLRCNQNQLTSLDVSTNIALTELWCSGNQLTSFDVSTNIALIELLCLYNSITELDISNNPNIMHLDASNNELVCLNVKNGNSPNIDILYADYNPNLTCIEVSDLSSILVVWIIDPQTSLSENCDNACSNTSNITELTSSKHLIQILDLMGRETTFKPNTPLIYVYDDGSIEKVFTIE